MNKRGLVWHGPRGTEFTSVPVDLGGDKLHPCAILPVQKEFRKRILFNPFFVLAENMGQSINYPLAGDN